MKESKTYIYTLSDPRFDQIRYVGKADDLRQRFKTHFRKENTRKTQWFHSLLKCGITPLMEVLDEVPKDEWMFWEQHWIQVIKGWGFDLVNGDNGGLGRQRLTEEIKARISRTLKGRPNVALSKVVYRYKVTGEYIDAFPSISAANKSIGRHGSAANLIIAIRNHTMCGGFAWSHLKTDIINLPKHINGHYVVPVDVRKRISVNHAHYWLGKKFSLTHKQILSEAAKRRSIKLKVII